MFYIVYKSISIYSIYILYIHSWNPPIYKGGRECGLSFRKKRGGGGGGGSAFFHRKGRDIKIRDVILKMRVCHLFSY